MANIAELVQAPGLPASAASGPPRYTLAAVPWRDMANRISDWDALADRAAEPNPFLESWYLLPALRAFDSEGEIELLRFQANGQLAGLLPIVRRSRYYRYPIPHLTSWLHGNCFLGAPLVARGSERDFWQALLGWADANAGSALFLHLAQMPMAGTLYEGLKATLSQQKRLGVVVHREERAMLSSQLSPDAYLEGALSGKKRKELRRQSNRLAEEGKVLLDRREDADGLDDWIEHFLTLEAAGWKGQAGSALSCSHATASLFRESLRGAAERGKLERLTLSLDGRPTAMLASFLSPPGAYSFKTAFDENYARFSPGVLLQRENLAMLTRPGIAWTDSCAAADHPMIDHIWRERRAIGRISIAIGGAARRAGFALLARAETRRDSQGSRL